MRSAVFFTKNRPIMSCFESSVFLKNPQVMDQNLLADACDQLGWMYKRLDDTFMVTYTGGQREVFFGEPLLVVRGNYVSVNRFHPHDAAEKVEQLREAFYRLNVEYAEQAVRKAFEQEGFTVENDSLQDALTPVGTVVDQPESRFRGRHAHDGRQGRIVRNLVATGVTRIPDETEPIAVIRFSILDDGTVVSDSNYIPRDVHDDADQAMLTLDRMFGSQRREGLEIRRKKIPPAYRDKAFCSPKNKTHAKEASVRQEEEAL